MTIGLRCNTPIVDPCPGFMELQGVRWNSINEGQTLTIAYKTDSGREAEFKPLLEQAVTMWNSAIAGCDPLQCIADSTQADLIICDEPLFNKPIYPGSNVPAQILQARVLPELGEPDYNLGIDYDIGCVGSCNKEFCWPVEDAKDTAGTTDAEIVNLFGMLIGSALGIPRLEMGDQETDIMAFDDEAILFGGVANPLTSLGAYDIDQFNLRYSCNSECTNLIEVPCEPPDQCWRWRKIEQGGTIYVGYDASTEPVGWPHAGRMPLYIQEAVDWWNDTVKCDQDIIQYSTDPNQIDFYVQWEALNDPDAFAISSTLVGCATSFDPYLEDFPDAFSRPMGTISLNLDFYDDIWVGYMDKLIIETLAHEIGHSLGIPHPTPINTTRGIMGYAGGDLFQLSSYDIEEIRKRYPCCETQANRILPRGRTTVAVSTLHRHHNASGSCAKCMSAKQLLKSIK